MRLRISRTRGGHVRLRMLCLLALGLTLAGCALQRRPAARPEPGAFTNTAFGWQASLPAGWRATATGGAAEPATSPGVTFVSPDTSLSQDEYLAVRLCRPADCLPAQATPTGAATVAGQRAIQYVLLQNPTPGQNRARRVRQVHTLLPRGDHNFDLVLSRREPGNAALEATYGQLLASFRLTP